MIARVLEVVNYLFAVEFFVGTQEVKECFIAKFFKQRSIIASNIYASRTQISSS